MKCCGDKKTAISVVLSFITVTQNILVGKWTLDALLPPMGLCISVNGVPEIRELLKAILNVILFD